MNFEDRLGFGKVIAKNKVALFFRTRCRIPNSVFSPTCRKRPKIDYPRLFSDNDNEFSNSKFIDICQCQSLQTILGQS